jgi:predicted nucleotidyltransferase
MRTAAEIIRKLAEQWAADPAVDAIFLFGSHATGTANPESDIDLCVLLREGATFDFPGLCRIEGHLVETFTGSRAFFEKFFEHFHKDNSRIAQTQFATAKILFDRNGQGAAVQSVAHQWLEKPRVTQTVEQAYWPKRIIFSSFERLERLYQMQSPAFRHAYHAFVQSVYSKYAAFLGEPVMDADRLLAYLTNEARRQQYLQRPFSDATFAQLLTCALSESELAPMLSHARQMQQHAIAAMGGQEIPDLS